MANEYRRDLDVFKGIAIIAVVLYHLGILKSGYLAVDLFLVINGFLIIPSVCRQILDGSFKYGAFIKKRTFRLLPIVIIATIASLIGGAWGMLPDHYENLAQSVVASNLMSGNILSSLTAKNYWSALNDYKPLQLSVYPNPVTDQLNIVNPDGNIQTVSIYNASGQLVLQTTVPHSPILEIPVNNLPNGFYIGTATLNNHQTATFKFIK